MSNLKHTREHWSFSAISQYLKCPLQYFFERVLKIPRRSVPSSLVMGSAVHAALAEYHYSLVELKPCSLDQLVKTIQVCWSARSAVERINFKAGETESRLIEQSASFIELYLKEPVPKLIVAIEAPMWVPIETSHWDILEKPLLAIMDLVEKDNDRFVIREFKTSVRNYSESEVAISLQATSYAYGFHARHGTMPDVQFTVFVKTKTPKLQNISTFRSPNELQRFGDLVQEVESAVNAQIYYPVESTLNCSGCSYFHQCKAWRSTRRKHPADDVATEKGGCCTCSSN